MILLAGLWHSLKVISAALYWLLSIGLIWAGLVQMGTYPSWGWACIACVLAIFALRGYARRYISPGLGYVLACTLLGLFLAMAWVLTGYQVNG